MDRIEKALSTFRKPYSCAQAVWAAFGDEDTNNLAKMKENSGGRAPENMCGALFAAISLLPESSREAAIAEFVKNAGSTKCSELKSAHKTKCEECVKVAAEIVQANLR